MFSISKDYAPPFKMIEPFFKFGAIAYLISIISLLFFSVDVSLLDLKVVGWVHMFLLSFVMIVIFGAMAQLIPVALEIGHYNVDYYKPIFLTLSIGSILMILGFWINSSLLPYGGAIVLVSMVLFLYETLKTLKKTDSNTLTVRCVKGGNIFLTVAILIGFLMALSISLGFNIDFNRFLPIHIVLVLVGYVTITVIGMSMILLPMFGLAHGYDDSDVELSFKILVGSIILFSIFRLLAWNMLSYIAIVSMLVGIGLYLRQLLTLYKVRARKINDIWYMHIYTAFISLAAVIVLVLLWLLFDSDAILKTALWLFLIGFFVFVINGHLIKIIPFLVWFERFSPLVGKKKVPMLHEMLPSKEVDISFWLSLAGLVSGALGLLYSSDTLFKGGVSLLVFGALFMLKTINFILDFKPEE